MIEEIGAGPTLAPKRWRHKKRGSTYTELGRGRLQVDGDLDNEKVVVYVSDSDGSLWVRPVYEFEDGRFEPHVQQKPLPEKPRYCVHGIADPDLCEVCKSRGV